MSEPFLGAKRFVVRMRDDKVFRAGIIIHRYDPKKLAAVLAAEGYRFTQAELQQAITEVDNLGSLAAELRGIIFY
jgi:hypothetical protein